MDNGTQFDITDSTQRLPIRIHADGYATVNVTGSKGDTYTLRFTERDGSDATCTCKGWKYAQKCYHRSSLIARLRGEKVSPRSTRANRQPRKRVSARAAAQVSVIEPVRADSGSLIKKARKERNWTQADLAQATGMKRCNISRLESGAHRPSLTTLERVAQALGIKAQRLLG